MSGKKKTHVWSKSEAKNAVSEGRADVNLLTAVNTMGEKQHTYGGPHKVDDQDANVIVSDDDEIRQMILDHLKEDENVAA
jgi:hypothetical protein